VSSGSRSDEQVKFHKKATIKQTFLPCNKAGHFCQRIFILKWRKKEKATKRREVCEILLLKKPAPLPVHHGYIFVTWGMGFCHGCGLCAATAARHVSRDLTAIYLAVGCTWINHKCRGVAEGRIAYMINLPSQTATHLKNHYWNIKNNFTLLFQWYHIGWMWILNKDF